MVRFPVIKPRPSDVHIREPDILKGILFTIYQYKSVESTADLTSLYNLFLFSTYYTGEEWLSVISFKHSVRHLAINSCDMRVNKNI